MFKLLGQLFGRLQRDSTGESTTSGEKVVSGWDIDYTTVDGRLLQADEWVANGQLDKAVELLDQIINENPGLPAPLVSRSNAHLELHNLDQAITDASKAIKLCESLPSAKDSAAMAYNNRGYAKFLQQDMNAAIADLRRATELDQWLMLAQGNLAVALFNIGDYGSVYDVLEHFIKWATDKEFGYFVLSRAHWCTRKHSEAVEAATKGLHRNPSAHEIRIARVSYSASLREFATVSADRKYFEDRGLHAYQLLTDTYTAVYQNRPAEAARIANACRQAHPEFQLIMVPYFSVLDDLNDHARLATVANEALRSWPNWIYAAEVLFSATNHLGQHELAANILEEWLRKVPASSSLRQMRLVQLLVTGKHDEALAWSRELFEEYPLHTSVVARHLDLLLLLGLSEEAYEVASKLNGPQYCYVQSMALAISLIRLGRSTEAREAAKAAVADAETHFPGESRWERDLRLAEALAMRAELNEDADSADQAIRLLSATVRRRPSLRFYLPINGVLKELDGHPAWSSLIAADAAE